MTADTACNIIGKMQYFEEDTIAAPATIPGTGALSIIRVSGNDSISICDRIINLKGPTLAETKGGRVRYGIIFDEDDAPLDAVVVSVFRSPHSYTGEDSVEITCHASSYITSRIMGLLCSSGARLAGPGEFTKRAFLNGKMDLSQAEAVADIISCNSKASHRVAMNQLRGGYSKELSTLRDELLQMTSLLELELDFSEEDVEFADRNKLGILLEHVCSHIDRLVDSFKAGNAIKNGIPVAIVGPANAGKSTLLNALLNEDRAIVSNVAGTTRDTIEEVINLEGVLYRFIDTAGIRDTSEEIENTGIKRSLKKLSESDVVLLVMDLTKPAEDTCKFIKEITARINFSTKKVAILLNKCDQSVHNKNVGMINNFVSIIGNEIYTQELSAKNGIGIDQLKKYLAVSYNDGLTREDTTFVTNARHLEALKKTRSCLGNVATGLLQNSPTDIIAEDLRSAISHISSILGQDITPDTILHHIFANHCVGK